MNENEKKTYIAITIGPIIRTFGLTSTPSALWASSFLFSYIARRIREHLCQGTYMPKVNEDAFISPYPYYEGTNILDRHKDDGQGLLHDHIIFLKPQGFAWNDFQKLRDAVIQEACDQFTINQKTDQNNASTEEERKKNLAFLKQYMMVFAVEFQNENPIMGSSKMLDCAELASTFVKREENNPILSFFTNANDDEKRNEEIKNRGMAQLGIKPDKWQLLYKKSPSGSRYSVKNLPAIAQGGFSGDKMKKRVYYAVVRSDGDNMGKLIGRLRGTDEFQTFSAACLAYCENIAEKVKEYKGMTVYAGGDDLLAILPCESLTEECSKENGAQKTKYIPKTIFHFVREANKIFANIFLTKRKDENSPKTVQDIREEINASIEEYNKNSEKEKTEELLPAPSLTWGITLCHSKYPLYEALEDSAGLLFGAKGKNYKNALNLRLIKHSGQTSAVYIHNDALGKVGDDSLFFSLLNRILNGCAKPTASSQPDGSGEDGKNNDSESTDQVLLSCLHTIREFEALFLLADKNNAHDLFKNMFDANAHAGNSFLHEELPDLYVKHCLEGQICALDDSGNKVMLKVASGENESGTEGNEEKEGKENPPYPNAPEALHYLLRILKFFVEKAGEKE